MKNISVVLDNIKIIVKSEYKTIFQLINHLYTSVSHFCYNKKLIIAGNCRMCLVEIANIPKPIVACSAPITPNSQILTNSAFTLKARENVLEFILLNHPLDCPVCDQGGECDLQEFSLENGQSVSRNFSERATKTKKNLTKLVRVSFNKCINCTKCVRGSEFIGISGLSLFARSKESQIYYFPSIIKSKKSKKQSEVSGYLADVCPVTEGYRQFPEIAGLVHDSQLLDSLSEQGAAAFILFAVLILNRYPPDEEALCLNQSLGCVHECTKNLSEFTASNVVKTIGTNGQGWLFLFNVCDSGVSLVLKVSQRELNGIAGFFITFSTEDHDEAWSEDVFFEFVSEHVLSIPSFGSVFETKDLKKIEPFLEKAIKAKSRFSKTQRPIFKTSVCHTYFCTGRIIQIIKRETRVGWLTWLKNLLNPFNLK